MSFISTIKEAIYGTADDQKRLNEMAEEANLSAIRNAFRAQNALDRILDRAKNKPARNRHIYAGEIEKIMRECKYERRH